MNKKHVEISKSSLLSLKAEVLRKQEEVNKAKLQASYLQTVPKVTKKIVKNAGIEERNAKDVLKIEIDDVLKKSRQALEKKSQLYEKLSKGETTDKDEIYLVEFDKKELISNTNDSHGDKAKDDQLNEDIDNTNYPSQDPEDDWVEYTDCLGRSRMCLRKDLLFVKSRDRELSKLLPPDKQGNIFSFTNENEVDHNLRCEQLHQLWEKQEQELLNKKNIHYQDVLFNEARTHGVGFYNFSQDEEERAKQQSELKKLREETKTKQTDIQKLKEMREKQIAQRTKAARNRKRARMGLPPEEDEPENNETSKSNEEEKDKKAEENEEVLRKEQENKQKILRNKHVRPWDIGKEGVRVVKTQEQWVKEKREERPKEFAPPTAYSKSKLPPDDFSIDVEENNTLFFSTKKKTNAYNWRSEYQKSNEPINPYKKFKKETENDNNTSEICKDKTSNSANHNNKYLRRNISSSSNSEIESVEELQPRNHFIPTPIVNECENSHENNLYDPFEADQSDSDDADDKAKTNRNTGQNYVEIPPPPTFEYYGPSGASTSRRKLLRNVPLNELKASIEAGLKFLRKQSERQHAKTENVGYFD